VLATNRSWWRISWSNPRGQSIWVSMLADFIRYPVPGLNLLSMDPDIAL
jgi:hypothetical protein